MAAARKVSKARWQERMWSAALDAQFDEIAGKHGKEAARKANYGWGDASGGGRIDVATKVYVGKGRVLCTTADYPDSEVRHEWRDY